MRCLNIQIILMITVVFLFFGFNKNIQTMLYISVLLEPQSLFSVQILNSGNSLKKINPIKLSQKLLGLGVANVNTFLFVFFF